MDVDRLLAELVQQGELLDRAAGLADPQAPVPSCPGWTIASAIRHLARVHRRVTAIVRGQDPAAAIEGFRPEPPELTAIYRDGLTDLVQALRDAPDDLRADTLWPADSARQFWARRQAHETAIHRADAERAAGEHPGYDPAFAADGVDELLFGFFAGSRGRLVADPAVRLGLRSIDSPDAWTMTIGPDGREAERGTADADCTVSGPASELYLLLWNRTDASRCQIDGDAAVLDLWREKAQISWR